MKKNVLQLFMTLLVTAIIFQGCSGEKEMIISLENPVHKMLVEEPVVIKRSDLEKKWGRIADGKVPVMMDATGTWFVSQVDDTNGDGKWDELVFLYTLPPLRKTTVQVILMDQADAPEFENRTNIRMARIEGGQYIEMNEARRLSLSEGQAGGVYHLEGPGWENDVVGFRNYLDARNGMDIFGKVVSEMVLDRAGINEDYHLMQDWGHDILRVGTSLGAGALAVVSSDVLHRAAPEADGNFEIISEGPIRSTLRLTYNNWNVDGKNLQMIQDISIYAAKWYYESTVWFPGFNGEMELVSGIATIDLGDKDAYMKDYEGKVTFVATHGQQSYDKQNLGMAIMVKNPLFSGIDRIGPTNDPINNSLLVKMKVQNDHPVNFRFYSCWELSDKNFADENHFLQFLDREAEKMENPIKFTLQ
jgi:hypothetical protein